MAALMGTAVYGCGGDGPTEPMTASLSDLFGAQLYKADGSQVSVGSLNQNAVIGIYFASAGCPACGAFTPMLVDAYDQLKEDGQSFEVALITYGITEPALFDYMVDSEMSWLAVSPLSDKVDALVQRYNVRFVPTLVIIDNAANTISLTGREELAQNGAAAYDAWLAASGGG
jgi:nucleoredoxin